MSIRERDAQYKLVISKPTNSLFEQEQAHREERAAQAKPYTGPDQVAMPDDYDGGMSDRAEDLTEQLKGKWVHVTGSDQERDILVEKVWAETQSGKFYVHGLIPVGMLGQTSLVDSALSLYKGDMHTKLTTPKQSVI